MRNTATGFMEKAEEAMATFEASEARTTNAQLFWAALATMVFGAVLAAATAPGVETSSSIYGDPTPTGSQGWHEFGLAVMGIGSSVMLVALVAYAVSLGIRAART
jgi:hypothetical protein